MSFFTIKEMKCIEKEVGKCQDCPNSENFRSWQKVQGSEKCSRNLT